MNVYNIFQSDFMRLTSSFAAVILSTILVACTMWRKVSKEHSRSVRLSWSLFFFGWCLIVAGAGLVHFHVASKSSSLELLIPGTATSLLALLIIGIFTYLNNHKRQKDNVEEAVDKNVWPPPPHR